jgi:hypothetical protein
MEKIAMRVVHEALIAGAIVFVSSVVAQAETNDCRCHGIVLNGTLNTFDFSGGVGYGSGSGGMELVGYTTGIPSSSAFAFAHARAFAIAQGVGRHVGHSGWGHGGFGGGGHR